MIPRTKVLPVEAGNVGGGGVCLGVIADDCMGNGMVGGLEWVSVLETLRLGTG